MDNQETEKILEVIRAAIESGACSSITIKITPPKRPKENPS